MNSVQKHRMTHQRKVILEVVQENHSHLTADEIYEIVRKKLPRISMGTVYRNLDVLATQGLIKKLDPHYPQMRFDHNTKEHYHLICSRCEKICDAEFESSDNHIETLEKALGKLTRFGIFGHKLEFIGLCPECMEKEQENNFDIDNHLIKEVLCNGSKRQPN